MQKLTFEEYKHIADHTSDIFISYWEKLLYEKLNWSKGYIIPLEVCYENNVSPFVAGSRFNINFIPIYMKTAKSKMDEFCTSFSNTKLTDMVRFDKLLEQQILDLIKKQKNKKNDKN